LEGVGRLTVIQNKAMEHNGTMGGKRETILSFLLEQFGPIFRGSFGLFLGFVQ